MVGCSTRSGRCATIEQVVLHGGDRGAGPQRPITDPAGRYAAAHVVPATADNTPGAPADLDWDRRWPTATSIWSYGLGVADAMDTAQRGMGMDWPATRELIGRCGREAAAVGGLLACGAGTDQLVHGDVPRGRHGLTRSSTPTVSRSTWCATRARR